MRKSPEVARRILSNAAASELAAFRLKFDLVQRLIAQRRAGRFLPLIYWDAGVIRIDGCRVDVGNLVDLVERLEFENAKEILCA